MRAEKEISAFWSSSFIFSETPTEKRDIKPYTEHNVYIFSICQWGKTNWELTITTHTCKVNTDASHTQMQQPEAWLTPSQQSNIGHSFGSSISSSSTQSIHHTELDAFLSAGNRKGSVWVPALYKKSKKSCKPRAAGNNSQNWTFTITWKPVSSEFSSTLLQAGLWMGFLPFWN